MTVVDCLAFKTYFALKDNISYVKSQSNKFSRGLRNKKKYKKKLFLIIFIKTSILVNSRGIEIFYNNTVQFDNAENRFFTFQNYFCL